MDGEPSQQSESQERDDASYEPHFPAGVGSFHSRIGVYHWLLRPGEDLQPPFVPNIKSLHVHVDGLGRY